MPWVPEMRNAVLSPPVFAKSKSGRDARRLWATAMGYDYATVFKVIRGNGPVKQMIAAIGQ